jgi:NTE family protein
LLSKTSNPKAIANELGFREIDTLLINPSEPIDEIAIRHINKLPSPIKQFFGFNKQPIEGGVSLASYLMFEGDFMNELITLGYKDAKKQAKDLDQFFNNESKN